MCAAIAEAWRGRRYPAAFVAKLNEAATEAGEMQVHIEFAVARGYLAEQIGEEVIDIYGRVINSWCNGTQR